MLTRIRVRDALMLIVTMMSLASSMKQDGSLEVSQQHVSDEIYLNGGYLDETNYGYANTRSLDQEPLKERGYMRKNNEDKGKGKKKNPKKRCNKKKCKGCLGSAGKCNDKTYEQCATNFDKGAKSSIWCGDEPIPEQPGKSYLRVSSGNCSSNGMEMITTKKECKEAASLLELAGAINGIWQINGRQEKGRPHGCIYSDPNSWSAGFLQMNSPGKHPDVDCGSEYGDSFVTNYDCICSKAQKVRIL